MLPFEPAPICRRRYLALVAAGLLAIPRRAGADVALTPPVTDEEARKAVEERARAAGLGPFRVRNSSHFQALGDVPGGFLDLVLADCEDVAGDFVAHVNARGFAVALPSRRMTVVALSGDATYGRFLGERASLNSGGRYDFKNDRLIVYDYRPARGRMALRAGRLNLLTLTHEVTHQVCFDGGILDREGDAPRFVVEGLATYTEERPPGPRPSIGRINATRLDNLAHIQREVPWPSMKSLLADDDAILGRRGGPRLLLAYAQSWLFTYYFMRDPSRTPAYRAYLAAIRPRRDPARRLDDASEHLGDLDTLDVELRRESIRLLKSR